MEAGLGSDPAHDGRAAAIPDGAVVRVGPGHPYRIPGITGPQPRFPRASSASSVSRYTVHSSCGRAPSDS